MLSAEYVRQREALEELVQTEGWRLFVTHITHEWKGEGFHYRVGSALKNEDREAASIVYRTSLEIFRELQWPTNQILELKGHPE